MTNLDHLSTETLADYAEGLLRESEASAVDAHLDQCAECRAEEELLKSLSLILAADNPGPMPAIYAERIDRALAEVAMTDPLSGSFHPQGSAFEGAALDLTPSAFAATSSTGGDGPSADVVDISSRRRGVAQSLSRVTTVAASIVLLIGGTVLGLQAINSGEGGPGTPDSVAERGGKPIIKPTTRPAPRTAATAVPVDPKAKKNSDGSWTNPDGTVIRTDRSAVKPNGDVIPAPPPFKLGPGEDPAAPDMVDQNPDPVTKGEGGVNTARGPVGPVIPGTEPTTAPEPGPAVAPGPVVETPAAPAAADPPVDSQSAKAIEPDASPEPTAGDAKQPPAGEATPAAASGPYFDQSNDTYDKDNFAKKVLALLNKGNYQASSTGEPSVDPRLNVDPAADPEVAESPAASPMYTPSSINIAMTSPTAGESAAAADSVAAARPAFKAKAKRCASVFQGELLAADQGVWKGKIATVIVMTDPTDPNQVVGRVVTGGCKDRAAVESGLQHTQFVVTKT